MRPPDLPETELARYLSDRDVACPNCSYNLRSLNSDHCPECNELIELRIGLAEPRLGTFLGGLVGLAAGAGFSGLLLGYVLLRIATTWRGVPAEFLLVTSLGLSIEAGLLAVWVRRRHQFRSASRRRQIGLMASCWFLTALNLAAFAYFVN